MDYGLATASQILPFVKQNLGISGDGSGDDIFILDSIKMAFHSFRNRETVIAHNCLFQICDKEASLPVSVSKIEWVQAYDTDQTTLLNTMYVSPTTGSRDWATATETGGNGWINQDTDSLTQWMDGTYWLDGNTVHFYTDAYNDKFVRVRFRHFRMTDEGEPCVPEMYLEGIAAYATATYWLGEGLQGRPMYREWKEIAINKSRWLKGVANTSSGPQDAEIASMQSGVDTKYATWVGW